MRNALGARLLLALAALLLALLGAELAVRLFWPELPPAEPRGELLRGGLTAPGDHELRSPEFRVTVHVNRDGFVDREWGPRRPGVARLAVIGDSFVQAAQVPLEAGFGRRLEAELSSLEAVPVEVLSFGVPGAGPPTELGVLRTYALPRQPDAVLLGFLVANDVLNCSPVLDPKPDKPFYRLEGGRPVPVAREAFALSPPSAWLFRRSQLWRKAVRLRLRRREEARKLELGRGLPVDLRVFDPAGGPEWERAWELAGALLAELAADCRRAGVPLGIVLFPSEPEVSERARAELARRYPELRGWDFSAPRRRALRLLEPLAPVLDLAPGFTEAAARGERLYYREGHWTPAGHALAARLAAPFAARLLAGELAQPAEQGPDAPEEGEEAQEAQEVEGQLAGDARGRGAADALVPAQGGLAP